MTRAPASEKPAHGHAHGDRHDRNDKHDRHDRHEKGDDRADNDRTDAQKQADSRGQSLEESARKLRTEARRIADIEHDLRVAVRGRTWSGPASERFERKVGWRLRELESQRDTLVFLAERLDEAAHETRTAAK